MGKDILTLEDVAETLGQSLDAVRRLFASGEIPGRKIGGKWYCTKNQLCSFIEGGPSSSSKTLPPTTRPEFGRKDNGWTCAECQTENDADHTVCIHCDAPRLTPLINFRLSS
jgi:excisionase family DNA binding protein